ncbi:hypothetical protein EHS25_007537 [Saitozyma podzolica]|uniref:Uncharacterized protein n=1 Tax=Saitozyma podzolica TaxID=1890683 RepID=A0A427YPZ4_9TREE|nr:hypothetical protein EHS25_007537 [Saitozyma podzolica]
MYAFGYDPLDEVEGHADRGYLSITEGSSLSKSSDMVRIMKEKSQDGKFSLYLHTDDPSSGSWHTDPSRLGSEFTTTGYVHTSEELTDGDVKVKATIIPFEKIEQLETEAESDESNDAATDVQSDQNRTDARPQIARTFAMSTTDESDFLTGSEFITVFQNPFGMVPVELWIGDEETSPAPGQTTRLAITEHVQAKRE